MQLDTKFTIDQIETINRQAMLYICACPAQIGTQIISLRNLSEYQRNCSNNLNNDALQVQVHQRIAEATQKAHAIMEQCLDDILALEGWDRTTLKMPTDLRILMEKSVDDF